MSWLCRGIGPQRYCALLASDFSRWDGVSACALGTFRQSAGVSRVLMPHRTATTPPCVPSQVHKKQHNPPCVPSQVHKTEHTPLQKCSHDTGMCPPLSRSCQQKFFASKKKDSPPQMSRQNFATLHSDGGIQVACSGRAYFFLTAPIFREKIVYFANRSLYIYIYLTILGCVMMIMGHVIQRTNKLKGQDIVSCIRRK